MKGSILIVKLFLFALLFPSLSATGADETTEINKVASTLDKLHRYASEAKAKEYFALFAEQATYIGTDASETWTIEEFKTYVNPYFAQGKGWTYTPQKRHVYLAKDKQSAWFDELLHNEKYGISRGTGVLILENGAWKIAQYHLTFPIPNPLAQSITEQIKRFEGTKTK